MHGRRQGKRTFPPLPTTADGHTPLLPRACCSSMRALSGITRESCVPTNSAWRYTGAAAARLPASKMQASGWARTRHTVQARSGTCTHAQPTNTCPLSAGPAAMAGVCGCTSPSSQVCPGGRPHGGRQGSCLVQFAACLLCISHAHAHASMLLHRQRLSHHASLHGYPTRSQSLPLLPRLHPRDYSRARVPAVRGACALRNLQASDAQLGVCAGQCSRGAAEQSSASRFVLAPP